MNEPFAQPVATLQRAQGTMKAQLERLGRARVPDRVRLPRLQIDARQFRCAAAGVLDGLRQQERNLDLIQQTKALIAWFDDAERRATLLLQRQGDAGSEVAHENDDIAHGEAEGSEESEDPSQATDRTSGAAVRPASGLGKLRSRAVKLGHSGQQPAKLRDLRSRRSLG